MPWGIDNRGITKPVEKGQKVRITLDGVVRSTEPNWFSIVAKDIDSSKGELYLKADSLYISSILIKEEAAPKEPLATGTVVRREYEDGSGSYWKRLNREGERRWERIKDLEGRPELDPKSVESWKNVIEHAAKLDIIDEVRTSLLKKS